jgi:hypothetical protein
MSLANTTVELGRNDPSTMCRTGGGGKVSSLASLSSTAKKEFNY